MSASVAMPTVTVEIAFNAGFATPAASRTWTDVTDKVELHEGLVITGGRSDERATTDASTLRLTLDNTDGRFTPRKASSPYYPNVKVDRPIRVTSTPVDGGASTRFVGFVNEWPTQWDGGTDAYAKAVITASSRIARMGNRAPLRSIIEETFLTDAPFFYYTLGEPADSTTAADSSGNAEASLTVFGDPALPLVFGTATGPATDALTAAQFATGQYLARAVDPAVTFNSVEFFFDTSDTAATMTLLTLSGDPAAALHAMAFDVVGGTLKVLSTTGAIPTLYTIATGIADGRTHHVCFGGASGCYVDGVAVSGLGTGGLALTGMVSMSVGGLLTGNVSHVAAYATALTDAQVAAHATAGLTGFADESTDARLKRYAALRGIAATEIVADAGTQTMTHVDCTGKQALEMMRICELTEGGVLFDGRDGSLTFHNRSHRYAAVTAYTLNCAADMLEADYQPRTDRTTILNDVSAASVVGGYSARKVDTASTDDHGTVAGSYTVANVDPDAPLQLAEWYVYSYAEPVERAATLTVNVVGQVGKTPDSATVLSAGVGSKVSLSNRPDQASTAAVDYFVEGYAETYNREAATVAFNLSPSSPTDTAFILGDAVRGVLGSNPLAY